MIDVIEIAEERVSALREALASPVTDDHALQLNEILLKWVDALANLQKRCFSVNEELHQINYRLRLNNENILRENDLLNKRIAELEAIAVDPEDESTYGHPTRPDGSAEAEGLSVMGPE